MNRRAFIKRSAIVGGLFAVNPADAAAILQKITQSRYVYVDSKGSITITLPPPADGLVYEITLLQGGSEVTVEF